MNSTGSTNPFRLAALAAATAALSMSLLAGTAAAAPVTPGPSGNAFYTSTPSLTSGKHGLLLRYRAAQAGTTLPDAASSYTVLYKSTSLSGAAIAVSGSVWIPKGTAPAGGWKVISWAHGTTGAADVCAPSKSTGAADSVVPLAYNTGTLNELLKAGYAVAATDYEGLGTPGFHPYLLGHSEGRGVIDIVAAARQLPSSNLSSKWVASGHSQGGHAASYAAADAAAWTASGADTSLSLKGLAAFAPANSMKIAVLTAKAAIKSPNGISGLGALIVRSMTQADTSISLSALMAPAPYALRGLIDTTCDLGTPTRFGQFAPGQLLNSWTSPLATKALNVLAGDKMSPNSLNIKVPTLILQGTADSTVLPNLTKDILAPALRKNNGGSPSITYRAYTGLDHGGIVASGSPSLGVTPSAAFLYAKDWMAARLG